MQTYLVSWEMEIDAADPIAAAERARAIMRDPDETWAGTFQVLDEDGNAVEVDLDGIEDAADLEDAN